MLSPTKRYSLIIIAWCSALVLGACNNVCDDVEPPNNNLRFFLLTPTWENLLGKGPSQYRSDSIQVRFQEQIADFEVVPISVAGLQAGPLVSLSTSKYLDGRSDARFFVQLSRLDTDTLDVTYSLRESKCSSLIEYNSVFYNGRRMGVDGNGFYQLVKRP